MESNTSIRNNFYWSMLERVGTVGIQFILQLLLARLLAPDDYGLCAILLVFVNIFTLLVDSGLPTALVQSKKYSQKDFSSVFYAVLVLSVLAYIILYISAPFCARFFDNPLIESTLRVMSVSIIFCSVNSVQVAYVKYMMLFKIQFLANSIAVIVSAVVSIYMAMHGYGVWAIVYQYLISRIVMTLLLGIMLKWRPTLELSMIRLKELFSYGWKLMASNFLSLVVSDIYTAVIGKTYSHDQLGLYDTGSRIPTTVSNSLTVSIGAVLFPLFSKHQEDIPSLRQYLKKSNVISSFFIIPLMIGLASCSKPIVLLVLTEKWADAIPFMQIACLMYAFYPIHMNNLHMINAVGRSDIGLKLEVIKKIIDIIFLAIFISIGLEWVAFGRLLTSFLGLYINLKPNKGLLGYSVKDQLLEILPTLIISVVMGLLLLLIEFVLSCDYIIILVVQFFAAVVLYLGLSYVFNRKGLMMTLDAIKNRSN